MLFIKRDAYFSNCGWYGFMLAGKGKCGFLHQVADIADLGEENLPLLSECSFCGFFREQSNKKMSRHFLKGFNSCFDCLFWGCFFFFFFGLFGYYAFLV